MTINKTHINQCSDFTTSAKSALFKTFEEVEGGGGGSPAGEDRELQLNDEGAFGGAALFVGPYSLSPTLLEVSFSGDYDGAILTAPAEKTIAFVSGDLVGNNSAITVNSTQLAASRVEDAVTSQIGLGGLLENAAQLRCTDTANDVVSSILAGPESASISYNPASGLSYITADDDGITLSTSVEGGKVAVVSAEFCPPVRNVEGVTTGLPPASAQTRGCIAIALDGRREGETAGNGTGCPVWCDGTNWLTFYDNSVVQD